MNKSEVKFYRKGDRFLISGPIELELLSGSAEIVGYNYTYKIKFEIPQGKRIPIEFTSKSKLKLFFRNSYKMERLEKSTIPEEWNEIIKRIINFNLRKIIVLGAMDTGKSFFCTFIGNRLFQFNKKVAIIDCDVGQSDIGPSGSQGLLILDRPVIFLQQERPDYLYFVGAHSPGLHITYFLAGVKYLVDIALSKADIVIINTTGWISGDGGRLLKNIKLELVKPDLIVLMQRGNEIEHLVKSYPSEKLYFINTKIKTTITNQKERQILREKSVKNYFKNFTDIGLNFDNFIVERAYFKTGTPFNINTKLKEKILWSEKLENNGLLLVTNIPLSVHSKNLLKKYFNFIINWTPNEIKGLMVGLCDKNRKCIGVGIIKNIDFINKKLYLRIPLIETSDIKILQFGSIKYNLNFEEAGFILPGGI